MSADALLTGTPSLIDKHENESGAINEKQHEQHEHHEQQEQQSQDQKWDQDQNQTFFSSLADSIFQPGVNNSLFQAMNASFALLLLVLFGLAFLTSWSGHVLFLMSVSAGLWGAMVWFVHEITQFQEGKDGSNLPPPPPPPIVDLQAQSDLIDSPDHENGARRRMISEE